MSTEFGLFSDEGLVEGDIWSEESARARLATYHPDDELVIAHVCPECREGLAGECDECAAECACTCDACGDGITECACTDLDAEHECSCGGDR